MLVANIPPQGDLATLRHFVAEEFQRLAIELSAGQVDFLKLAEQYTAPAKPREGLVVFADGTSWNPGAGRGVYVYSSAAWVKL